MATDYQAKTNTPAVKQFAPAQRCWILFKACAAVGSLGFEVGTLAHPRLGLLHTWLVDACWCSYLLAPMSEPLAANVSLMKGALG